MRAGELREREFPEMDAEKPRFTVKSCTDFRNSSVVSESGHFERQFGNEAARLAFKKMSTPWSDGQGGVGSRFSLRADFCDEVRRSPAEDADRPMYWRPPWLGGAQLENRALPTSTFLVSVRSGLYVRTEPEVHVPQPLA